jgi:hypothetical protein
MPEVTVWPLGSDAPKTLGPPQVVIKDRGCQFVLVFEDMSGDGKLLELCVRPDQEELEPRVLRQFAPQADLYVSAARAAIRWDQDDLLGAVEALRKIGRPGRGLTEDFYRAIAQDYRALVSEGEPHPIKSLGEKHHVSISAASRWVKEARRRGFIKEARDG